MTESWSEVFKKHVEDRLYPKLGDAVLDERRFEFAI